MIRVSTANQYLAGNASINLDQSALLTTEAELSSGKQVNSPSDNPVGAAQASLLQSDVSQLSQYATNQSSANNLLNNGSSTLTEALNTLQSANTTLVQAGNGTLSASDRTTLAQQLQQDLNQLVGLANSSDGQGGYLFGGSVNSTPPFAQNGNRVSYVGDNVLPGVQISQTRSEQVKYSGQAVFMSVPTGNGSFVTAAGGSNTGTGSISVGSVNAPSSLTGDHYTITVGAGGTYTVADTTTGNASVTSGALSTSGATTLSFDGMTMSLSGAPAAGDQFTVAPSGSQSVFSVLAGAISALQAPNTTAVETAQNSAALSTALNGVSQSISSLSTTQASMGAQLQELQTYGTITTNRSTQDQTQISSIVDLNYASGVSQLSQQQTQFQAALQSYASISKLSLFNYVSG
jgi:flagellar hook-associated protein 3 FlgL